MPKYATGCKRFVAVSLSACLFTATAASAAEITLFEGDGNFFGGVPGGFAFDDFGGGKVTETATSLIIDADTDQDASNGIFGGLGRDLASIETFDAANHQIRIVYRALANNAANDFRIILRDNDGDDSGAGLGTEDFQFFVDTSSAIPLNNGSGYSEQFVSLNPVFRDQSFGFANDGDTLQNYGLDQWQIQSAFGGTDRLNIEVQLVEIIPVPEPGSLSLIAFGLAGLMARYRK